MFSDRENQILKLIGSKKTTVREISSKFFTDKNKPFDAEICINNSIRRIIEKCEYHKLDWTIDRDRQGHKYIISKVRI